MTEKTTEEKVTAAIYAKSNAENALRALMHSNAFGKTEEEMVEIRSRRFELESKIRGAEIALERLKAAAALEHAEKLM